MPGYLGRTRSCARGTTTNVHRVGASAGSSPGSMPCWRKIARSLSSSAYEVPRGQLEDVIRAVRRAARDADAEYKALLARREWARREAQAQHERLADPAKRTRLAEDQARIDAVLAETEQ
jgi:hypothetical protein